MFDRAHIRRPAERGTTMSENEARNLIKGLTREEKELLRDILLQLKQKREKAG